MRHPNPSRTPAARLESVTKTFGRGRDTVRALDDIDLELEQGKVTSILGPNGAGKTTAVKLMLGLLRPDAGQVELFGRPATQTSVRIRTGAMMQISSLPDTLRVEELIRLFRSYYAHPMDLERVLDVAGLRECRRKLYGHLSGGQKQRVVFALAACGNPDLLFLDEPTVGLDVETRRAFWSQIRRFIELGKTIVLTTHYLEEADALSDRIVVLQNGRICADGSPAKIKASTPSRRVSCVTRLRPEDVLPHPDVHDARVHRARLEIAASDGEEVVRHLLDLDPTLRDLEVVGAGIDEAFLHLTGNEAGERMSLAG